MDRKKKTIIISISIILLILVGIPAFVIFVLFCPHTTRIFFDRERLENEFYLELTDDVKLVSYRDESFLIAIDNELTVEVDDAESFMKNNITCDIEEGDPKNGDDYKYSGGRRIYIRIEPLDGKYRVHLEHRE